MRKCVVLTCKNRGMHIYPTDPILKQQWIRATRVDYQRKVGWNLRKTSCICSDHFRPDDFEIRGKLRPLKKTAVPSIFPWNATISSAVNDDDDIAEPEDTKTEPSDFKFNPAKVVNKYSKSVPIRFIEEYPYLNTEATETNQDPLQSKIDKLVETSKNPSPGPVGSVSNYSKSLPTRFIKENPFSKIKTTLVGLQRKSDEQIETSKNLSPVPVSLVSNYSKSVPTRLIKKYPCLEVRTILADKDPLQSDTDEHEETSEIPKPVPVSLISNYSKSVTTRIAKYPFLNIGTEKVCVQRKSDKHAETLDTTPVPVSLVSNCSKTVPTRFKIKTEKVPLQSKNAKATKTSENPSAGPVNQAKYYTKSGPSRFDEEEFLNTDTIETDKIPVESKSGEHAETSGNPSPVLVKCLERTKEIIKSEINSSDQNQISVCVSSPIPVEFCTEQKIKSEINSTDQNIPVTIEFCQDEIIKSEISSSDQSQILFCDRSAQTEPFPERVYENNLSPFSVHKYKHNDKAIHFYTGLDSFSKLKFVFSTLGECPIKYFDEKPPNELDAFDQFFMTLLILRRHMHFKEIGFMYLIPAKQVKNIFITWIRFMALQWKNLDLWNDKNTVMTQKITLISYKTRNTLKFLVGISRSGLITYISPCCQGSAASNQRNQDSLQSDRKVPGKRVRVEEVIGILKSFKIVKQPLNVTETTLSREIAFICAMLVNFQSTIVNTDGL